MKIKHCWLCRNPLLGYYAAVYGISWGIIFVIVSAHDFDLVNLRPLDTGLIFAAMLLGPSVGGLAMTALLDGHAGLRRLWVSLMRWRVGVCWYAVALLTMPLLLLTVLWPLSVFVDAAFAPGFRWPLFAIGLVAGSFEEIGWTGFATPRLLVYRGWLTGGLMLGLVWALWHILVDFRANFDTMRFAWLLEFAVFYIATLTPYRILMTWVYSNTRSLLLAILMHASYTGWLFVLYPATSSVQDLVWQTTFAVALWVMVAVLAMVLAAIVRRQPLHAIRRTVTVEQRRI